MRRVITGLMAAGLLIGCGRGPMSLPHAVAPSLSPEDYAAVAESYRRLQDGKPLPEPLFQLADPGSPQPVDYTRFGRHIAVGTADYHYVLTDTAGLIKVVGEGIHPNETGVLADPRYVRLESAGKFDKKTWEYITANDPLTGFYAWTQVTDTEIMPGTKTLFTGMLLERAGLIVPALKAYHAALVHFPRDWCWGSDHSFLWYIAPTALGNIQRICRDYPELQLELADAYVSVANGGDTDPANDIITVNPGHWVRRTLEERQNRLADLSRLAVTRTRGKGRVQVVQYFSGQWELRVDGHPLLVRGITYQPTEVGVGPKSGANYATRWMFTDKNRNGRIDAAYDAWVDANRNDIQDENEPAVGDFQLMKDMGINAVRIYDSLKADRITYDSAAINKPLLRELCDSYGIRVIMGDYLGAFTLGSGASPAKGTDYTDTVQRRRMKEAVRQMVLDLKDEPFVLMWMLGNGNTLRADYKGVDAPLTNASRHPRAYAEFVNEVATMIHELDPDHPVAICNQDVQFLSEYARSAPEIDILGVLADRGEGGFGDLFFTIRSCIDLPALVLYGSDCYFEGQGLNEEMQVRYDDNCRRDLEYQQACGEYIGNCIGGVVFEWLDEWWRDGAGGAADRTHQVKGQHPQPFADNIAHLEWMGLMGQGSGRYSPFERQPRQVYQEYVDAWNPGARR